MTVWFLVRVVRAVQGFPDSHWCLQQEAAAAQWRLSALPSHHRSSREH
jgi:hypothetical protein